jgi:hypothetical protein
MALFVRTSAPAHRPLTERSQLREWGVEDAVTVLSEEQPEYFAHTVASVGDATPGGLASLPRTLCSWIAGPYFDDERTSREEWPTAAEVLVYQEAYSRALRAGMSVCEEGCSLDDYDPDPDIITADAIDAARATLETV